MSLICFCVVTAPVSRRDFITLKVRVDELHVKMSNVTKMLREVRDRLIPQIEIRYPLKEWKEEYRPDLVSVLIVNWL